MLFTSMITTYFRLTIIKIMLRLLNLYVLLVSVVAVFTIWTRIRSFCPSQIQWRKCRVTIIDINK